MAFVVTAGALLVGRTVVECRPAAPAGTSGVAALSGVVGLLAASIGSIKPIGQTATS